MKKLMLSAAILAAALVAGPSLSQVAEKPGVGDCISDGFNGNEPNIVGGVGGPAEQEPGSKGGRVVPSQSPGPFLNAGANEPPRNDRVRGRSVGQANQDFDEPLDAAGFNNIAQLCRADPGFFSR